MSKLLWIAESFRLTLFPIKPLEPIAHWWSKLVGELPLVRNEIPRQGSVHEEGPLQAGKLVIETQPIRVDCVYASRDDQPPPDAAPHNVGVLAESLLAFRSLIDKLSVFKDFPELSRLAFGVILLSLVEDRKKGYEILSRYLPFKLDAENSSDFLYQINRSRVVNPLGTKIKINRLSKWSVMESRMLAFQIMPQVRMLQPSEVTTAVRLELDINTSQETPIVFTKEQTFVTLPILVDNALELAEKGDVP